MVKIDISFITCTYNGERVLDECLKNLTEQDYPKNKIEVLIADGGSTDNTLQIIEKYRKKYPKMIKFEYNAAKYDDGKGAGKDTFSRKSKGEIICILDQDNILVQKDWIKKILKIFKDRSISGVQSRMAVPEKGSPLDKYIGFIGIEDPFAIPYSLNAQIVFNPEKFEYNSEKDIFVHELNKNDFYYAGSNGFCMRRKDFFEAGGYTQDIDNFYRMANSENRKYKIAIPREIRLYHKTSASLKHMLIKRGYYVRRYLLENYQDRDFYWFSVKKNNFKQNIKFIKTIIFNLILIPGIINSIRVIKKERNYFIVIHPLIVFLMTLNYLFSFVYSKFSLKTKAPEL